MEQQTDVKARIVLIVWNLMLTVAVIAMSFRLAAVGSRVVAVDDAMLDLMEEMVETDENLANALITNAESIDKISGVTVTNSESVFAVFEYATTLSDKFKRDLAEIYQGHIIPIRAILMETDQ